MQSPEREISFPVIFPPLLCLLYLPLSPISPFKPTAHPFSIAKDHKEKLLRNLPQQC